METTPCKQCGKPFEFEPIAGLPFSLKPTTCNACDEQNRQGAAHEQQRAALAYWRQICPDTYRDTDPNHQDMPPAAKQAKILNWKFGPRGLVIHGPTRHGKTRCVWMLLKRIILEGRSVGAVTATQFANYVALYGAISSEHLDDWRNAICNADVLFIDDLGKWKLTERVESELWHVIEERTSRKRPIIITTNATGETLKQQAADAKTTPDRVDPILERIREFCESVTL